MRSVVTADRNKETANALKAVHAPLPGQPQSSSFDSFAVIQKTIGNQAVRRLFGSRVAHAKLHLSRPSDADEVEANRIADQVIARSEPATVQRKCACRAGSSPCSKCAGEEETIHRSASASHSVIHRAPLTESEIPKAAEPGEAAMKSGGTPPRRLIVEDEAESLTAGQMRKSDFIERVRSTVCVTADALLASVGRSTRSCPYIEKWLLFYADQSSAHLESSLRKYVPEAVRAAQAQDYLPLIKAKVAAGVKLWIETGNIAVPPGVPLMPDGSATGQRSAAGTDRGKTETGTATAAEVPRVQRKASQTDPKHLPDVEAIRAELGSGTELEGQARSRMESVFHESFSHVRVHTDANAARLSSDLHARAFTLGGDIAFANGEYQPGTLAGDALIAHELAHVVQQGAGVAPAAPMKKSDDNYGSLEMDADQSAAGAMLSLWTGAKGRIADIAHNAVPRLRSGVRLQRCEEVRKICPKGYSWRVQRTTGLGSFGCLCHWKCLPGEPPGPPVPYQTYRCPPDMNCKTGVRYEELDSSYTKTGYGAAFTPLGEQAFCGCFPLNKDGEKVSDSVLRPTDFEMMDVLGPVADLAAARSGGKARIDPRTGKPLPEETAGAPSARTKERPAIVGDLGVDVEVGMFRVNKLRESLDVSKRKNIAFADVTLNGKPTETLVGVSGDTDRPGAVPKSGETNLPTLVIGHTREFDSEKKILEHLASELGDNTAAKGTVNLFSERPVCAGCSVAISTFQKKYPGVVVNIVMGPAKPK